MGQDIEFETNRCDICKKPVISTSSDIWVSHTVYEPDGEVHKAGQENDLVTNDYLVICDRPKCSGTFQTLWEQFVKDLAIGGAG